MYTLIEVLESWHGGIQMDEKETILDQVLRANEEFVHHLPINYVPACKLNSKPKRHLAIFTCMDTRLVDFLEPALGIGRGEAKVIKNAGNTVTGPFHATIRSLMVAIYELGVKEVMVIGHLDCGMAHSTSQSMKEKMLARGICPSAIKMIEDDLEKWLDQFHHPIDNVEQVVARIRSNPLIPTDVPIHGLMFNPHSGAVNVVVNGYKATEYLTSQQ